MAVQSPRFTVTDFIAVTNQTLEYAYPFVEIEGEIASFKVNQGKFVFFDLKDNESSVGCFMMVFALRVPIEDGMKVIVRAVPKLTKWGKFSLTVQQIRPSGEGSLKKSFELLKAKLEKEGLFAAERKRQLPAAPSRIGIIASTQSAGYADFIKIISDRWGGLELEVAHVQVQGDVAPDQIIRALRYFNQQALPDVIVMIRGGGSADDLSAFNDELLVRAIAESRVPVLTGIGHEIDESLSDLVADVMAATPSNAAQLLVPDKHDMIRYVRQSMRHVLTNFEAATNDLQRETTQLLEDAFHKVEVQFDNYEQSLLSTRSLLSAYDPRRALERGYAIARGEFTKGATIEVETQKEIIEAEVRHVNQK